MKSILTLVGCSFIAALLFTACSSGKSETPEVQIAAVPEYGGYASNIEYGQHLVTICGCNDCHTPKKMTPTGFILDTALMLSGHPSSLPHPDVDRKQMEAKGMIVTNDLTCWVGPWGVSYTANLTPDATGIGNWEEEQFFTAIRHGKFKGMESSRPLLPPMPWEMYRHMTDKELRAVFAYLKSLPPVKNIVPAPDAPASLAAK